MEAIALLTSQWTTVNAALHALHHPRAPFPSRATLQDRFIGSPPDT
jgi:hypothetical protein